MLLFASYMYPWEFFSCFYSLKNKFSLFPGHLWRSVRIASRYTRINWPVDCCCKTQKPAFFSVNSLFTLLLSSKLMSNIEVLLWNYVGGWCPFTSYFKSTEWQEKFRMLNFSERNHDNSISNIPTAYWTTSRSCTCWYMIFFPSFMSKFITA